MRTRFAPSPTGFLHIGGVRTALFNWLLARQSGGQFILRIDDTDQQRNVEAALAPILAGFRWLGIDWDEGPEIGGPHGPYFQSQRAELYAAAVSQLLENGSAYRDFARSEEVQAEREAAEKEKRPYRASRRWAAENDEQAAPFEAEGREAVVRLNMPKEGDCKFDDLVLGPQRVAWANEQDHVIQRADGSPLYHLATVVDDQAMKISHVVRAQEHLSNTPRQIFIAQSLGYELPQFGHLPVVAEPGSKTKLSKRKLDKYLKNRDFSKINQHGQAIAQRSGQEMSAETFNPVIVDFYEQVGYLPDALVNYLLLLGWSLDDKTEDFSRDEMIRAFSLDRVVKSPASFDPLKLLTFQERQMQRLPLKQKVARALPFLQKAGLVADPAPCDLAPKLSAIMEAAGDRIKVAGDILQFDEFFLSDAELAYDKKAFDKRLRKEGALDILKKFRPRLAMVDPFTAEGCETSLKQFVDDEGIKIGDIIHALRVALTGKGVGLGMFETLAILCRECSLARIDRAIDTVEGG